jgi:hypothetical protein
MAMRWSSAKAAVVAVLGACVTTTTREFLPSRENPIYRPAQASPVLAEYLRLQCPALRKANRPDSGRVEFAVTVDTSGFATRARLVRGSGDQLVDEVFGTVAAQLAFPRDTVRRRVRQQAVTMAYRCQGDSASVVVR